MLKHPDRVLVWLLRFAGLMLVLAWPTIFLPTSLQAELHTKLGLGTFPASSLVDYLTRSIAVLYGTRGLVYWLLSGDIRRYLPVIRFFGAMDIVAGIFMLGIGLRAELPMMWVINEGPPLIAFGVVLLWLCSKPAPDDNLE